MWPPVCSATSRLLLHKDIEEAFLARLRERAESIRVGDPREEDCRLGPLVSEGQHQKVLRYIQVRVLACGVHPSPGASGPSPWHAARCSMPADGQVLSLGSSLVSAEEACRGQST